MKKLETFSYLLHCDGCTLYFAVLEPIHNLIRDAIDVDRSMRSASA